MPDLARSRRGSLVSVPGARCCCWCAALFDDPLMVGFGSESGLETSDLGGSAPTAPHRPSVMASITFSFVLPVASSVFLWRLAETPATPGGRNQLRPRTIVLARKRLSWTRSLQLTSLSVQLDRLDMHAFGYRFSRAGYRCGVFIDLRAYHLLHKLFLFFLHESVD